VLFVSFVLIDLSHALNITRVVRFLDRSGFILFIVLCHFAHGAFLQLLASKEAPYDGIEPQ
jgi:hypothetical protein